MSSVIHQLFCFPESELDGDWMAIVGRGNSFRVEKVVTAAAQSAPFSLFSLAREKVGCLSMERKTNLGPNL